MFLGKRILSLLLPQTCRVCGCLLKDSAKLCSDCFSKIRWIREPLCTVCGRPFESSVAVSHPCPDCLEKKPAFDRHRSCVLYEEPVNRLLHRLKYSAGLDVTGVFAGWFQKIIAEQETIPDYLIPVPLSTGRLRRRSYNQSVELARHISRQTGIPVLIHSLQKIRDTVPQTELPREERIKNLKGAFAWKDKKTLLKGKNVLLVDDVFTTGSTLMACASVLKSQKPADIGAMTIAFNLPK
ncbi:MAG: ComF family protein [Deltaproteobacteria bacterium]|nr:ComF family protein [Deltaproteobacteria bacterium]